MMSWLLTPLVIYDLRSVARSLSLSLSYVSVCLCLFVCVCSSTRAGRALLCWFSPSACFPRAGNLP